MVLIYWWVAVIGVAGILGTVILYRQKRLGRFTEQRQAIKVAHSSRITSLPEYQTVQKAYRRWLMGLTALFVIGIGAALLLASRPAAQSLVTPAEKNRDIMLCLDVSGSMSSIDAKLAETFQKLVKDFEGQRIGLDMFDANVSQVFPLNDDYALIGEQLALLKKYVTVNKDNASDSEMTDYYNFFTGTRGSGMKAGGLTSSDFPSSNAGLGLAGCVRHLGDNQTNRSQSIIFATDNELYGDRTKAIISTTQAMMLAKQKGIRVYAIDPGVYNEASNQSDNTIADNYAGEHAVLKNYAIMTSGAYYRLSSVDIVPDIISQISKQEAKLFTGDSQYAASDAPLPGFILLLLTTAGLVFVVWRLKL